MRGQLQAKRRGLFERNIQYEKKFICAGTLSRF